MEPVIVFGSANIDACIKQCSFAEVQVHTQVE